MLNRCTVGERCSARAGGTVHVFTVQVCPFFRPASMGADICCPVNTVRGGPPKSKTDEKRDDPKISG